MRVAVFAAVGCQKNIPNTTVADTPANRSVITFMENYRNSVESRDVGALLAMAHPQYLDDNGTPSGDDDIDYRVTAEEAQPLAGAGHRRPL